MKKPMIVLTVPFVAITVVAFFVYPYLHYPAPSNLDGVYIRYSAHEFGKEWDTMIVAKQRATVNTYQVMRRWKYERVLDGNTQLPEYKKQVSKIRPLDNEAAFVDEESGISYSYDESKQELSAGTTIYKKIK